jgi:ribose-phosphate pyrophosphokinase
MCKYVAYIIDTLNHDGTMSGLLDPAKRISSLMERHRKDIETQMKIEFEK